MSGCRVRGALGGSACGWAKASRGTFVAAEAFCTLTAPLSTSWLLYRTIVAHDMTILGNWVKSTRGCLSFLAIACESTIISEYKA